MSSTSIPRPISDKMQHDLYTVYAEWLAPYQTSPVRFVELGVLEGASLLYFEDYFTHPDSRIVGVDIHVPTQTFRRAEVIQCDQSDPTLPVRLGPIDIVIDDASHDPVLTRRSFDLLWPSVRPGGVYIIEDWHPSVLPAMHDAVEAIAADYTDIPTLRPMRIERWVKSTEPVAATIAYYKGYDPHPDDSNPSNSTPE